jgi:D-alanyl-D-alanine-carboxypeptidase/D-alanyl-D-alanine-endopeptidase
MVTLPYRRKLFLLALLSPLLTSCGPRDGQGFFPFRFLGLRGNQASAQSLSGDLPNSYQLTADRPLRLASLDRIASEIRGLAPRFVDPTGSDPRTTPGLVVAIVTESGEQFFSFGTKKIGTITPPDSSTLFPVGSLTKLFTGLVLAQLVQEDRLKLDESASRLLPASLPLPTSAITLRHLVTNTSGLPNYPSNLTSFRDADQDGINDYDQFNPGRNYTQAMLSEWLASGPSLESPPGINAKYSNLGFGLLGLLLEQHLGYASFNSMIGAKVVRPLSLSKTSTTDSIELSSSNIATGYSYSSGRPRIAPIPDMGALAGAGELISNADDLIVFLKGLTGLSRSGLSPAFRELNRPIASVGNHTLGYGMKINESQRGGSFALKTASTSGFSAVIAWRTRPRIGIVILANRGNYPRINQLARHLIENAVR